MIRTLLALVAATILATPALVGQCPALTAQIEEALAAAADLPEETRATVTAMLEEGMAQHEAGDHAASEATLFSPMEMQGIAPG
jgi:hypothetical protein